MKECNIISQSMIHNTKKIIEDRRDNGIVVNPPVILVIFENHLELG